MKKLLFACSGIAMFLLSAVCFVLADRNEQTGSSLFLANVEALARFPEGDGGTCGYQAWTGDSWVIGCNLSKEEMQEGYNWWDTPYKNWCCDSCGSSSYCG